jgi:phosphoglycerate dehydrogenase-like enzyme
MNHQGDALRLGMNDSFAQCRVIARYGTGVDIVEVDAATRHGILVTSVPNEWCQDEVADHAMALLLAEARKLRRYDQLPERADFLVIQAPLTPSTHNLLDEAQLRRLKHTTFLINTARGPIVNDQALYRRPDRGVVRGPLSMTSPKSRPSDAIGNHPIRSSRWRT